MNDPADLVCLRQQQYDKFLNLVILELTSIYQSKGLFRESEIIALLKMSKSNNPLKRMMSRIGQREKLDKRCLDEFPGTNDFPRM